MKNYTLETIINGKDIKFDRKFNSRNAAISFALDYLNKHYIYNTEIEEEILLNDNKHNVEYVCNDTIRIVVARD